MQVHLLTINDGRVHLFCQFCQLAVSLLVVGLLALSYLSIWVDDEYFAQRDSHVNVTNCIGFTVSKSTVKRGLVFREELQDILEAGNLEYLGFAQDYFSVKRPKQTVWTHDQGTLGQSF